MSDTTTRFGLSAIAQVALTVRDVPRAAKFYRDSLGLPVVLETPEMVFFQAGDIRLMLGLPEREHHAHSSIVYFKVDDILHAYNALQERGVSFTHEPRIVHRGQKTDVWLAFFHDPDLNALALMSETARRD
ncbi:MAG TPA: VOC family protein [Candidatus Krumholzibacteria bacterium]|nr:VOC family protein [Candidatus Krumholzibacteria bacterium]